MESAKTDYAAALAIPAQITGDLPSTVLGKTVTWSATGDGAKLVAADGKVTQPKSGEKAVKVKLTATIDGVDKAITAESEILNNGGEIASYVKDVDRSDQNGAKYDPLAYNDDRRADSLYVAAKAADGSKWETLNRSQSILSVKWDARSLPSRMRRWLARFLPCGGRYLVWFPRRTTPPVRFTCGMARATVPRSPTSAPSP